MESILAILIAWCAASVVVGLVLGRLLRAASRPVLDYPSTLAPNGWHHANRVSTSSLPGPVSIQRSHKLTSSEAKRPSQEAVRVREKSAAAPNFIWCWLVTNISATGRISHNVVVVTDLRARRQS